MHVTICNYNNSIVVAAIVAPKVIGIRAKCSYMDLHSLRPERFIEVWFVKSWCHFLLQPFHREL